MAPTRDMTLTHTPPAHPPGAGAPGGPAPARVSRRAWGRVTAVAARAWAAPAPWFVAAMSVLALVLRVPRLGIRYWGDEAISLGIASHPLAQIPHYLRFDGSPPLWYVLLHGWMAAFGSSNVSTHTLSLIISLLAIPAAWWCASVLFGPRAARPAALIAAVCPYLTYYGTETRMYVLAGVLAMLAVTGWVRALRAPPGGGHARRWLALAVLASVAVIYTHNWGLFLIAALTVVGAARAWLARDRTVLARTAVYAATVTVAYLPWLPSFWWQLHYTGAPWSPHPSVIDLAVDPFRIGYSWAAPVVAVAIAAAMLALRSARRRGERQGPAPSPPSSRFAGTALGLGAAACAATVVLGWVASEIVHSWAPRYLGVALVPAVVVMAGLFSSTRTGRRLLPALAAAMALTAVPVLVDPAAAAMSKSNVAAADSAVRAQMAPGDLVITTAMAELPVIAYYLPPGLRYATPLGQVHDTSIVDWENLPARLDAADPTTDLAALLRRVPVGGHVFLVNPLSWRTTETPHRYESIVAAEGIAVSVDLLQDPAYTVVKTVKPRRPSANPVEGILFTKTG